MQRRTSLFRLILSMLIFGTIGIFRRALPVSSAFLAMFRGFAGSLFLFLMMLLLRKKPDFRAVRRRWIPLLVSGGLIGLNWILLFESYRYTTVAVSTMCYYMSPVFVMIASPFLLHQRLGSRKIISLVCSIAGMLLITGILSSSPAQGGQTAGILFGLGAALLYACVVLINQTLSGVPSMERTILQLLSAGVVVLPYTLLTGGEAELTLSPQSWGLLLIIGFIHTALAYVLYFSSMDGLRAPTVAIISYLDPLTAVVLSALLLHEPMDLYGILGTAMILFAAVYAEVPFPRKQTEQK